MRAATLLVVPFLLGLSGAGLQDPVQDAEMLKRAQELAQLAAPHRRLTDLVGSWNVAVDTRLPDGSRRQDSGTVEGQAMLGGRYVRLTYRLQLQGHEVLAEQILGFDTLRQLWTSSWRDDLSTWSVECSGVPDQNSPDLLRLAGTLADARDPAGRQFRLELDLRAKDAVSARAFETRAGEEIDAQTQQWKRR